MSSENNKAFIVRSNNKLNKYRGKVRDLWENSFE